MVDIDRWRAVEREGRQAVINEQTARLQRGAERLVGHLPAGDGVFARPVVPVSEPEPVGLSRGAVFAFLKAGGDRETLTGEAAGFVKDYDAYKQGW